MAERAEMFFRRRATGRRGLAATLAITAALSVCCMQAFAEDQDMTVIAHASSGPLQCEIRKIEVGGSVELTGVIVSSRAIAGNFRFTVAKSGGSGSSNIHQANKFALAADKESHVGQVKINLERSAHVGVELFVGSDDGLECRVSATLEHRLDP
jgi:hypothetical protein